MAFRRQAAQLAVRRLVRIASGGVGYGFTGSETTKFAGTLGIGDQRLTPARLIRNPSSGEVIEMIRREATSGAVVARGLNVEHGPTSTAKLLDKLLVDAGASNAPLANDCGVRVSMTDKPALAFGYGVRYNTDPAPGTKKLDQLTTVNMVYNVK